MKSVWLVALLAALSATTMMIATDSAMARRGVHAGVHGVHVGNINRHPGWRGNYAGWRGGNWRRVGWGVGAAGLAIGAAAAASAYNYGGAYAYYGNTYPYDGSYAYAGTYAPTYYGGGTTKVVHATIICDHTATAIGQNSNRAPRRAHAACVGS